MGVSVGQRANDRPAVPFNPSPTAYDTLRPFFDPATPERQLHAVPSELPRTLRTNPKLRSTPVMEMP